MSAEQRHSMRLALDEFGGVRFAGTRDKLCLTGVAISCGPRNVQAEESRDRMLACWNYCAGIPTEKLTGTLLDRLMRVEAKRDRLLEALEPIRAYFRSANSIPVERATIKASDWALVEAAIAECQP